MNDWLLLIGVVLFFLALMLLVQRWMLGRAFRAVVRGFLQQKALSPDSAKTAADLGLAPRSFTQRLSHPVRDYKPYALNALVSAKVIEVTEDGRLYLVESELARTKWKR